MATIGIAILAAGKGTRLKIDKPKAICPALGGVLVDYVIDASLEFAKSAGLEAVPTVVVGHMKETVTSYVESRYPNQCRFAWQKEQRGTADAMRSYFDECPENVTQDYTFIACADTPLLTAETFRRLWEEIHSRPDLQACAATFITENPQGYGRIVREGKGFSIVEEKDATAKQREITEVNSAFYLVRTSYLRDRLSRVSNKNKSGEFYLTDVFSPDADVLAMTFTDPTTFLGVNTLDQLEDISRILRRRKNVSLMREGVVMLDAGTTYVDWSVKVGAETVIHPGVHLLGETVLGRGVIIEPGAVIRDSVIEDAAEVLAYSHLDEVTVRTGALVGPFARLRPETEVGAGAKVGNFVETKKARLAAGVKISHLSYVGDADIGENTNIGCGFITCNYDGVNKHHTVIGKNVFVGSDVQAVAPLEIGDNSFVAAGSTVTKNVPADGFAIARSPQVTKEGMAHKFRKVKKPS
jgi:bifunctional UDP-N-acetylglucosamine pyrophosphorylase/glucosamine-1-phosphate N-acetyltransferase